ncbi:MAG: hypothetical protein WD294_12240 [Phycisphaeraceae bacterium]
MTLATVLYSYSYLSLFVYGLTGPLLAWFLPQSIRRGTRVAIVLVGQVAAAGAAIGMGVTGFDRFMTHVAMEMRYVLFDDPTRSEMAPSYVLRVVIVNASIFAAPLLCGLLRTVAPKASRRFWHWLPLVLVAMYLGFAAETHIEAFIAGEWPPFYPGAMLIVAICFWAIWLTMRHESAYPLGGRPT